MFGIPRILVRLERESGILVAAVGMLGKEDGFWLTIFAKINGRPFISSRQIVTHPDSNEDDEQTDGGV